MLILSDFHFDVHPEFALPWKDGCNTRLRSQLDLLEKIFELGWSLDESNFVFLGDWFHKWSSVSTVVCSMVTRKLYELLSRDEHTRLYMLPGNHDVPDKRNWGIHTLASYDGHPKIRVIDQPRIIELDGVTGIFVPYHQDPTLLLAEAETLRKESKESDTWLFSHLDMVGAKTGLSDRSWISPSGLSVDDLSAFAGGFFGHYHIPQTLVDSAAQEFRYVGAPLHLSTLDADTGERGVLHVGENAGGDGIEFIPLDSPRFIKFDSENPPANLRQQDYHLILANAEQASSVEAQYRNDGLMCRILYKDKKKGEAPIQMEQPDSMANALESYVAMRQQGNRKLVNAELMLSYGQYYLESEE